jgi:hypothetical protein
LFPAPIDHFRIFKGTATLEIAQLGRKLPQTAQPPDAPLRQESARDTQRVALKQKTSIPLYGSALTYPVISYKTAEFQNIW